jgi:hypothetical protein
MRSRLLRHITAASIVLLGTAGVLVRTSGTPLGASVACGCEGKAGKEEPRVVNKEGKELVNNDFTGRSGSTEFRTVGRFIITCRRDTVEGAVTRGRENEGTMNIFFKECSQGTLGECTGGTAGGRTAGRGELFIETTWRLFISLRTFDSLRFSPVRPPFGFTCGRTAVSLEGEWLIDVQPADRLKTVYELLAQESEGVQEPDEYENEKGEKEKATLEMSEEGKAFEQTGIEGNEELTFEEEVEFLE